MVPAAHKAKPRWTCREHRQCQTTGHITLTYTHTFIHTHGMNFWCETNDPVLLLLCYRAPLTPMGTFKEEDKYKKCVRAHCSWSSAQKNPENVSYSYLQSLCYSFFRQIFQVSYQTKHDQNKTKQNNPSGHPIH